jgi:hypothetical protein
MTLTALDVRTMVAGGDGDGGLETLRRRLSCG